MCDCGKVVLQDFQLGLLAKIINNYSGLLYIFSYYFCKHYLSKAAVAIPYYIHTLWRKSRKKNVLL